MEKIKNLLVRGLGIIFSEGAFRVMVLFLICLSILAAVGHGIEGNYYPGMINSLNWVMWLVIVLAYSYTREGIQKKSDLQETYIKSLEDYKTLSDDQVKSLKDLVEAYKERCEGLEALVEDHKKLAKLNDKIIKKNEIIIEQYKSSKESRF